MGIATGGVVPEGADAVIPIEYVVEHDNEVEIPELVASGANVRPRGGDVRVGDVVARAGARVSAAQLGGLAAAGLPTVPARRRPRAAVLTTGTELRAPGEPLGPGEVYEANGVMLAAQLASAGALAEVLPAVADDDEAHRRALERALEADVVVTSGGVSVGPHDLVRRIEGELGVARGLLGRGRQAGKAARFGVRDGTLVFGLPGNPGVVARRVRALRPSGGAGAPGRGRATTPVRVRDACGCRSPERAIATSFYVEIGSLDGDATAPNHAAERSGVAHDRAGGLRRCARSRPTRRGRDFRRCRRSLSPASAERGAQCPPRAARRSAPARPRG